MNKPVMQGTNSRTIFDLSLSLRPSLHKNKPGVHLSFPHSSTCHLRDEETSVCLCVGLGEGESRGNSQERRHRHSWSVNCNDHSLLSHPIRIRSKKPGGRYDPKTHAQA